MRRPVVELLLRLHGTREDELQEAVQELALWLIGTSKHDDLAHLAFPPTDEERDELCSTLLPLAPTAAALPAVAVVLARLRCTEALLPLAHVLREEGQSSSGPIVMTVLINEVSRLLEVLGARESLSFDEQVAIQASRGAFETVAAHTANGVFAEVATYSLAEFRELFERYPPS